MMKTKIFVLLFSFCAFSGSVIAQDRIASAFSRSIELEYKGEYTKAITPLKEVYDEKSYELNLRLGWLTYEAAQYVESAGYYHKAMVLMPYSIEAKLGVKGKKRAAL